MGADPAPILDSITINGAYAQDGTPTPDNPVPVEVVEGDATLRITGKNMLPWPYFYSDGRTHNGITYIVNEDGSITANGTATDNSSFYITGSTDEARINMPAGTFTLSCKNATSSASAYLALGIIYSDGTTDSMRSYSSSLQQRTIDSPWQTGHVFIRVVAGTTLDNVTFYPQLEVGSITTEFVSPQGYADNTIDLNSGTNLLDGVVIEQGGRVHTTGGPQERVDRVRTATPVSLPAGDYSLTFGGVGGVSLFITYKNATTEYMFVETQSLKFTLNQDAEVLFWWWMATGVSQPITPSDLIGQSLVSDYFLGALPNGTVDTIDVDMKGNVVLTKRVGKVIFDGSEDNPWIFSDTSDILLNFRSNLIANNWLGIYGGSSISETPFFISDRFQNSTVTFSQATEEGILGINNALYIRISPARVSNLAEFRTWLASNPTTVYYQLASPYSINLGKINMPNRSSIVNAWAVSDPATSTTLNYI